MIEIFKGWVSSMLCVGIIVTIIQLIIPKTNLKKYIYALMGIITVITLISPVISILKDKGMEESVKEVLANFDSTEDLESDITASQEEEYKNKMEESIKNSFGINMKKDIESKLEEKGIVTKTIDIFVNDQYNIEKLRISIEKIDVDKSSLDNVTQVVKYINQEYDISYDKIEVEEG